MSPAANCEERDLCFGLTHMRTTADTSSLHLPPLCPLRPSFPLLSLSLSFFLFPPERRVRDEPSDRDDKWHWGRPEQNKLLTAPQMPKQKSRSVKETSNTEKHNTILKKSDLSYTKMW
ncbi:hypothetical protein NL108_014424 [Boleophthalmus pectinirostris]|nr:hypothetical protein NL108_014424 [Boleophthalmus pectinirostris]